MEPAPPLCDSPPPLENGGIMARLLIVLPLIATLAACETGKGFVRDVENTTDALFY